MRFFLDQDVYFQTAKFLRDLGHDVVLAGDIGLSQAEDPEIMLSAREAGRILVSRDRDFGRLAFRRDLTPGILYLRVTPRTLGSVHDQLAVVLGTYDEDRLREAFIVIQPGRYRIRTWVDL